MKKTTVMRLAMALIVLIATGALLAQNANRQTIDTVELTGWTTFKMSEAKVEATGGRTHLRHAAGEFEAKASSMTVSLDRGTKGVRAIDTESFTSADLQGDVWIVYRPKPGQVTEARASKAHIDWKNKIARLEGGVTVISSDPEVFAKPSQVKGDKATILLKNELRPDEYRVIIESSPDRSRVEVTPRPREQDEKADQ